MLHFIRDRAQGWIAWFIVGLISIPFALWGVNSYLTGASDVVVAEVNGKEIKQVELQRSVQQYRDQMRNMLGEQFDPAMFEGNAMKRSILDGLIEQQLLREANDKLGQTISDAAISNIIRTTPAFQRDGEFDSEYYSMVLARAGFSPTTYEAQLRNDLMSQELTQNIQQSAIVSNTALKHALSLEKQKREIAYGVIPVQDYLEQVNVEDDAVKAFYDNNTGNYMAPEQMQLNYIELSVDAIADSIDVSDDELKQFYADNQDMFVGPEQRRASHILVEGDDDAALQKIQSIKARIQQGEDFAEVAKTESDDTGSASQGGDLGYFGRDVMDPAFETAAFALQNVGDLSEPVKTEYGYHLIKLTGIREPDVQSFAKVRDDVAKRYRQQQAQTQFYDKAEQLANLSFENPDSLDVAAETLGLEIKQTDLFTRKGTEEGITSQDKVVSAAFAEDVLQNDLNSAVIELSDTDLVVIHKRKHVAASTLPFESVAPAIKQQMLFEKASDFAREKGDAMLAQVKEGGDAETLFNKWQSAAFYQRDSEKASKQILQRAFAMPKPADKPQYLGFTANNGNYVVIKLTAVENGDPNSVEADEQTGMKQQLAQMQANAEVEAFIAALKADADIDIIDKDLR
jgi:peptidyl-prolyl cis-trans isomerase D